MPLPLPSLCIRFQEKKKKMIDRPAPRSTKTHYDCFPISQVNFHSPLDKPSQPHASSSFLIQAFVNNLFLVACSFDKLSSNSVNLLKALISQRKLVYFEQHQRAHLNQQNKTTLKWCLKSHQSLCRCLCFSLTHAIQEE